MIKGKSNNPTGGRKTVMAAPSEPLTLEESILLYGKIKEGLYDDIIPKHIERFIRSRPEYFKDTKYDFEALASDYAFLQSLLPIILEVTSDVGDLF